MGLILSIGLMDGLGLIMFLPLLQMASNPDMLDMDRLGNLGLLVKQLEGLGFTLTLSGILVFLVIFFSLKGLIQYISSLHQLKIKQIFIEKVRISLINLLDGMTYKAFAITDAGQIQNALSGEVDRVGRAYQAYLVAFQQIFLMFAYLAFAFLIDLQFALLITFGGALTNLAYRQIYKQTIEASRTLTSEADGLQGLLHQYVNNFKYIKATGLIFGFGRKLKNAVHKIEENNLRIGMLNAVLSASREPLLIIVISAVVYIQVNLLEGSLGPILISLLFFYRALAALLQMQTNYNFFLSVSGSITNLDAFSEQLKRNAEKDGIQVLKSFEGQLELTNAMFKYNGEVVLDNINLKITNKETIAFVGESGSGKTTLVNVLAGLLPLDSGRFTIGEIDRSELDITSFRKRVGYITQEPVIFNASIFNNVTFWAEPNAKNTARFAAAIRKAAIADFIDSLQEKGDTELGNNGVNLSGGQRQRISIARELYKEVDILIFDEATSALDSETEKAIQDSLEALHGQYLLLIIAHRVSTIKHADRIIVMKKGKIIDQGKFTALFEKSVLFRKMTELQGF